MKTRAHLMPGGLVTLLAVIVTVQAHAQTPLPFDELGAGSRATAMGQAFTAVADDPSAAYYNPAGLVQVRTPIHLTLGYQYAKPRVWVDMEPVDLSVRKGDFNRAEDLSTRGLYVGFASNLAEVSYFKDLPVARRLAIGVALFSNLPEVNQFWNPQWPTEPYVFRYNERWSLISLAVSVGIRCTDWLSVGGGFLPRVDSFQTTTGSWLEVPADPDDLAVGFRMNLRQTTKINVVPIGGILVRLPFRVLKDRVTFGVSYRGKMWGYYGTGIYTTDVLWVRPGKDPVMIINDPGGRTVDYVGFNPEEVTGGIAVRPLQRLTLALDLTWKRYSAFHYFWDLPPDPPFDDILVPRFGIDYAFDPGFQGKFARKISEIRLLAGYYREPSPVGDMSGPMNILDADQNVVSGGFSVAYRAGWVESIRLEAFFQAHLLEERHIENDRDPLYGPIDVGGQVYGFGVALSIVY